MQRQWQTILGNNTIDSYDGQTIIRSDSALLAKVEVRGNQLFVMVNVYNESGEYVAKLRRGAWNFNRDGYEVTTHPEGLSLFKDDRVLFHVTRSSKNVVTVERMDLYTPEGDRMLIRHPSQDFPEPVRHKMGEVEVRSPLGREATLSDNRFSHTQSVISIRRGVNLAQPGQGCALGVAGLEIFIHPDLRRSAMEHVFIGNTIAAAPTVPLP